MKDTQNEGVNTLAQTVVDAIRKSGGRASLGLPSPDEMEQFRMEKAERDSKGLKSRLEFKDRKMAALKEGARESIQRNRDEQS